MAQIKTSLRNPNHPKKGASIKVDPIKDVKAIKRLKKLLASHPRDACLFTFGINTAYRANELIGLKVGNVDYLKAGDVLDLRQSKTKKYRPATLNNAAVDAIQDWLKLHPNPVPEAPLFPSARGGRPLLVSTVSNMVKDWCAKIGLRGNYGSHTLRKTWGFHQLRQNKKTAPHMVLPLLMDAYGHSSQQQTLDYLCIQSDEVANLFMQVEL